jgi:putative hydrolase of the HAD superfamily
MICVVALLILHFAVVANALRRYAQGTHKPPQTIETRCMTTLPTTSTHSTGFDHVDTWVFDLDNTLYPADCNLFAEVDQRMGAFIAKYLGVPVPYARHLQKAYYRQFGTTLAGMMRVHNMDPKAFLDYVHDIDLSPISENKALAAALEKLPGRKKIFTAGSHRHAERVAGKLGILDQFVSITDIVDTHYVPKSEPAAYATFVQSKGVEPKRSAMFEDMPHNLEPAHAIGMATVLVHSSAIYDSPVQKKIRAWTAKPDYVHHMTDNLTVFLNGLLPPRAA